MKFDSKSSLFKIKIFLLKEFITEKSKGGQKCPHLLSFLIWDKKGNRKVGKDSYNIKKSLFRESQFMPWYHI